MKTGSPTASAALAGKIAIVTGGSKGIGYAITEALIAQGASAAIVGRDREALDRASRQLGSNVLTIEGDARSSEDMRRAIDQTAGRFGGLDVLVNNAALFYRTPLGTTTRSQYDAMLAVNVRAVFLCAQAAAARMERGSHIVNIGDAGAEHPEPGWVAYALSKAAVAALTRGLGAELRPRGIAVNCVAPGPVLKPERLRAERWSAIRKGGGEGVTAVAAAVVAFSTCAAEVTGQVLAVENDAALRR